MYYIYICGELCCLSVFSGCCAALNSSLLRAFFSHLSTLNNPDTTGQGHNSFPEEYIWAIVGAVGGAAIALLIIMLLASILVVYATFKLKHRR